MTDAQLGQLKHLFEQTLSLPSGDREAFLSQSCSDDPYLRNELDSLLAAHEASDSYFEKLSEEVIGATLAAIESGDHFEAVGANRNVSHYEILERIGRGGMGVVYKARDTRLGRTVALKFLPPHHASNPSARARLLSEAKAASVLDHPNIGVIHEVAEADDGRQFIAMTWYDGETLKEKLRRGPLAATEVISLGTQLAGALAVAHAAGIIHRDVKPANVIITRSGSAKLLDFGIAQLMGADDGDANTAAGTVAYMSPEQTRGATLDMRTDVWSLGVLLYESLTGRRPFRRETEELTVAAIRNEEPAPISAGRDDIAAGLASVISTCLEKNPSQRYQSADDLSNALIAITGAPSRRSRTWPPLAAALGIVAIGATVWMYSRPTGDPHTGGNPVGSRTASVAVLPFTDSLSTDSTRYLAVGLSDDLRTELSLVGALTVPSYVSSSTYDGRSATASVAKDLAADFLVTGRIDRSGSRPRVRFDLLDGKTLKVLFSRTHSVGDSDIVANVEREILTTLNAKLTSAENARIGDSRTQNQHAYDLYLRGRFTELSGTPRNVLAKISGESIRQSQAFYSQARAADPSFGLVRLSLARSHILSASAYDTTQARLDQARAEAEAALRLDSGLVEARAVLADYWEKKQEPQKAISELEAALRVAPNNIALILAAGLKYIQGGRWEEGVAMNERAMRLDPQNPEAAWAAARAYGRLRRNDLGMKAFNHLIAISPDDHMMKIIKGQSYLRWKGTADTLLAEMTQVPVDWDFQGNALYGRYTALRVQRRYTEALHMLDASKSDLSRDGFVYQPKSLMKAEIYHDLGDEAAARTQYDIARQRMVDSLRVHPGDASIHAALGLAYAGLGQKRDAVKESERAMNMSPVSGNSVSATAYMGLALEVFGRVGELDRAFQMIELMLSMPSGREVTVPFLRVWPGFDPLRKDPRFDQLLARFTTR